MAYSDIKIKNPRPNNKDNAIPTTSLISFEIVPTADNSAIDISTLELTQILHGGITRQTETRTFVYGSPTIVTKGSATEGYTVSFDPFPQSAINFESNQMIEIRINVKNTIGLPMRQSVISYEAVDSDQYGAISDLIKEITEITMNYEQGRIDRDTQVVDFTYRNWSVVEDLKPKVFKNDIELDPDTYTVKFQEGKVLFTDPLRNADVVDIVNANYYYSALSEAQIISFMKTGLSQFNAYRPMTDYNLKNAPIYAMATIILGGAYLAINSVLMGFINQQFRVQFGDEKDWKDVRSGLENLRDTYKEQMGKMLEEKKYKLASSRSITIPEMSLPGGRSRYFRYLYKGGDVN